MRRAFTLIELLVVIAIIAILTAILFPVLAQAKNTAKNAVQIANFKQIGVALANYTADNDGKYPPAISRSGKPPWNKKEKPSSWVEAVHPYVKSNDIFRCPFGAAGGGGSADGGCIYPGYEAGPTFDPDPVGTNGAMLKASDISDWALDFTVDVGANSLVTKLDESLSGVGGTGGQLLGVMTPWAGFSDGSTDANGNLINPVDSRTDSQVTFPSATVLVAMKFHCDCATASYGNWAGFWGPAFVGLDNLDLYSPGEIPNGKASSYIAGSWPRNLTFIGQLYPNGPKSPPPFPTTGTPIIYRYQYNGAVSILPYNQMANFLFVDTHVKTIYPVSTNPDPVNNKKGNMWDAGR